MEILMTVHPATVAIKLTQIVPLRFVQRQRATEGGLTPGYRRRKKFGGAGYQLQAWRASPRIGRCQSRTPTADLTGGTDFNET